MDYGRRLPNHPLAGVARWERARTVTRWERQLDGVTSIEGVLSLTRDYLASLSPVHFARLPADCRPGPIKYEDDIDYWTYQLEQRYRAENDEPVDGSLLRELLDFFLHALIRLAELRRNVPGRLRAKAR